MSHTVSTRVELRDKIALGRAIEALGGQVKGEGVHRLYAGSETGFGFQLPGWSYPLVLKEDGTLAYDDFGGRWGNTADLDRLKGAYAVEVARATAQNLGWMCEDSAAGLLIYHPDGGTVTVTREGVVDANGFSGSACLGATSALEQALGPRQEETTKAELFAERARISARA